MKKIILFFVPWLIVLALIFSAGAVQDKKAPPQQDRLSRLKAGEILTDGGYLKKGVWAVMDGVVDAPPNIVWRLFIYANDWNSYRLPELIDCRAVDKTVLDKVEKSKKLETFYKALGERVIDPVENRLPHSHWQNYTFQLYNMPWPVSDRWFIIENFADETQSAHGIFKTRWESRSGNVRSMNGELVLEPLEGDRSKTLLHYRVDADPGSSIPRFMIRWAVKKSLPAAMRVIRREAVRLKNKPAPLLKIQ